MAIAQSAENEETKQPSAGKRFSVKRYIVGTILLIACTLAFYRIISNANVVYGMDAVLSFVVNGSKWIFVLRLIIEVVILFNWRFVVGQCRKLFNLGNRAVYVMLQSRRYVRMVVIAECVFIFSKLVRMGLLP